MGLPAMLVALVLTIGVTGCSDSEETSRVEPSVPAAIVTDEQPIEAIATSTTVTPTAIHTPETEPCVMKVSPEGLLRGMRQ